MPDRGVACFSTDGSQPSAAAPHSEGGKDKKTGGLPGFLKPLTDFGVGKTSVWEGGVGLFVLFGAGVTLRLT